MGIFKDLHNKQVNNGIFIALLLIFAAGIAVWWHGNGSSSGPAKTALPYGQHPLTQVKALSLCGTVPKFTGTVNCEDSEQQANVAGHSIWTDAAGVPVLRMDLITTANLSIAEPITSNAWFDNILPEIKASGRLDWAEPKGAWSKAAITRKESEQELLFEDNGVVVVMQSNTFDRDSLLKLADQTLRALRQAKPPISSADAAKPE